jgi:signal recognition particle receptor subunit alpha
MQNNEKLMRELAKLVQVNKPNMLLFVGEALVGNDGIDQLMMFNKALATYLPSGASSGVDGIFLTKFDTIDDKARKTHTHTQRARSSMQTRGEAAGTQARTQHSRT